MNKLKQAVTITGAIIMSLGFGHYAAAAPILFCNSGPGIDLVNDGCISGTSSAYPNGGDGVYSNAGGGDSESAVEAAILGATGNAVDIALYGKSDDNPELFTLTGATGTSGTWDLLNDMIDVAYISIKAANSFALYDVQGVNSGVWTTEGILNNGGQQPGLSHISFWISDGVTEVPEPATLLLLGAGLMGFWRKKTAKQALTGNA